MDQSNTRLYSDTHKWIVFLSDNTARIGISDYAQRKLKSCIFVTLPDEGDEVECGVSFGEIESVKVNSEIISPVSGRISAVNTDVLDEPGLINSAPYETWLVEVTDITDRQELMDEAAFKAYCGE